MELPNEKWEFYTAGATFIWTLSLPDHRAKALIMSSKYGNERDVEVPFALRWCKGHVLDVGKDKVGYTEELLKKGCTVKSCDPDPNSHADYPCKYDDLVTNEIFDRVLFLSSLEHFDNSETNLKRANRDIYYIRKARGLLNPVNGIIVITVPFGKEYIAGDFIQWGRDRVRQVQAFSGVYVVVEEVHVYRDNAWELFENWSLGLLDNLEYRTKIGASAVYLGVWKF